MLNRKIHPGRITAVREDDIVVFLLGARPSSPWRDPVNSARVFVSIMQMVRWLRRHPEDGLLDTEFTWMHGGPALIQYWDTYDSLERFARNRDAPHLPAWGWYRKLLEGTGAIGVWHETYVLAANAWECIYVDMPLYGMPRATRHEPIGRGTESSRERVAAV